MKKSRAYYQYMLDLCDKKVSYYSTDDVSQIVYNLLDEGDASEALSACQKGLEQHPGDDYIELVEAKVMLHLERYDEAECLLRGNPEEQSPFGLGIRFGIDVALGDKEKAFDALLAHLQQDHMMALEFTEIIDELFDHLPHHLTSAYLQKAAQCVINRQTRVADKDAEALGRMGALMMDCHCPREAIAVLEKALDADAYDIYSWQDLARCQFDQQMYDACRQSCEMGLAIDPDNPLFHFILGYILCQDNEHAKAIEHLEVARCFAEGKLKHENVNIERQEAEQHTNVTYELLGNCYAVVGQSAKACECYEVLVHRIPTFAEGYFRLATFTLEMGNISQALAYADEAILIEPENTSYRALRATLLTSMHQFDDAIAELDRVIALSPNSKNYLLAKAELCLKQRRFEDADQTYRALLDLQPTDRTTCQLMRAYFESIGDDQALLRIKR